MQYIEEKALEAQEHFRNLIMFAKKNKDKDANFMEQEIFQRLLQIGNAAMSIYIASAGTGNRGKHVEIEGGVKLTHEGKRKITHTTIFGEVPVTREYYYKLGNKGIFPLDNDLNFPERTYSYLLERFCMGVAVNDSYEEARKYIYDLFGINIPQSSIQKISKKCSAYIEDYYKQKEVTPIAKDDLTIVSVDGKGVPMKGEGKSNRKKRLGRGEKNSKKRMALVGTVYNVKRRDYTEKRDFKPENKKVWAFIKDKERTMTLLQEDVNLRLNNSYYNNPVIFIADGARGLWTLKEKYFPDAVEILDWYHMSEYLWKAVYTFYPEGSKDAKVWIADMENKMKKGEAVNVITGLKVRIAKNKMKGKHLKTLKAVISYFENNKNRMKYNEYIKNGYPIGSGNVESACRYLVKDRMEKTGMRWKVPGAQAVLSTRATFLNGDLNNYWNYYMRKENKRLYSVFKNAA
jgi:hypothetical protein